MRVLLSSHEANGDLDSLTRELLRRDHQVTMLTPGDEELPYVRYVRPPRSIPPGKRMEMALAALASKEALFKRPGAALIQASSTTSLLPKSLAALRVPVVLECQSPILKELSLTKTALAVEASRQALRVAISAATKTIANSVLVARHLEDELGAVDVCLIERAADVELLEPGDRQQARQKLRLPQDFKVVTLVGDLSNELRLDILAEAHRHLAGTALIIAGSGEQAPFAHAMGISTRPSCPVIPLIEPTLLEVLLAIRAADVCLDLHPMELSENSLAYAAMGRRQVCFDVAGADRIERLFPGANAIATLKDGSPNALRAAFQNMFAEEKRGPLGLDAVAAARRQLSHQERSRRLADLLEQTR